MSEHADSGAEGHANNGKNFVSLGKEADELLAALDELLNAVGNLESV